MAKDKDSINLEIKKKIAELDRESAKGYRDQLKSLNANNASLEAYNLLLENATTRIDDQKSGFNGLLQEIKGVNDELQNGNKHVRDTTKAFRGLESIASKLRSDQMGYTDLNKSQLKQEQSKLKILADQAKASAEAIKIRGASTPQEKTILKGYEEQFSQFERTNNLLKDRIKEENKYVKKLGVTGALLGGMSKIPIVGPLLKTNEALEIAREKAKAGGNSFQVMGAAAKSMGGSLLSSLSDPLVSIGLLVKGFKMFLDIGFKADTEITNLSKSMASSKEEAEATRNRFVEIQNSGRSIFNSTKNLVGAQLELADAFGVTRGFTDKQVEDQVMLTKEMKFQADEAAGIQQLAMSNGMSAEKVTSSVIKQTVALSKQTGIQLDNKKIIGEVAKVSGQLRLQYANNPALIAKAVIQTKKLGLSLEQAAAASKSLLNFESSIEDELSAELLTGKALNLERARGLALNGDAAGAAEEMLRQVGSAADFASMNVIQQEALAKAVGMSADDLANSLVTQENLAKLGGETKKQLEEKAEALRAEGKIDEANALLSSAKNQEDAEAALKNVSAQETFNESIETLKSMLSSIVEGPAGDFAAWIGDSEKGADRLQSIFNGIKTTLGIVTAIIGVKMIKGIFDFASGAAKAAKAAKLLAVTEKQGAIASIISGAWKSLGPIPFIGAALAAAAVVGGVGYLVSQTMNDGVINPTGGMVVSGPEGSIQLNKKDSIIAGTNLGGGSGGGNNSSDIRELKNMVASIANRPIHVSIDGKKVIEATTGAQPNTVGDESRKNSYRIS